MIHGAGQTPRAPLDFYPTPPDVTAALREWLFAHPRRPGPCACFLDPAAGEGHIVRAMRERWGESFWHAIELDPDRADLLEDDAENVLVGDSLELSWPVAHVIMNAPFSLLDPLWLKAAAHREKWGVWVASFGPVAWWNAEKRAARVRPDYLLALGWRPVFRRQTGPAHKGSQDFCWSILAPVPQPFTTWARVEKAFV